MFEEEEILPKTTDMPQPRQLDTLSIEELEEYIGWMENEIARVRECINHKQSANHAAEAFFKDG